MTRRPDGTTIPGTAHRIAIFDLDGTITSRDTLLPFLLGFLRRHPAGAWRLWRLPFTLARYVLGLSDRGRLKASLIRQVVGPAPRSVVEAWADEFCVTKLPTLVHAKAREAIQRHRDAGDRLVLLSASVDLYVPRIGRQFGFDETICTGLSWRGDRLEGRLTTANRRGDEKRRCVAGLRARHPGTRLAAYGNAESDFAHLLDVDEPLVVNAGATTRRRAARLALPCDDWR